MTPLLVDLGHVPHILTHDAITSIYLIKKREVSVILIHIHILILISFIIIYIILI